MATSSQLLLQLSSQEYTNKVDQSIPPLLIINRLLCSGSLLIINRLLCSGCNCVLLLLFFFLFFFFFFFFLFFSLSSLCFVSSVCSSLAVASFSLFFAVFVWSTRSTSKTWSTVERSCSSNTLLAPHTQSWKKADHCEEDHFTKHGNGTNKEHQLNPPTHGGPITTTNGLNLLGTCDTCCCISSIGDGHNGTVL